MKEKLRRLPLSLGLVLLFTACPMQSPSGGGGGGGSTPSPTFSLSLSPSSLAVQQGDSAQTTLTVTLQNGFTGTVNLSLVNGHDQVPQGLSLSPTSVQVTGSSLLSRALTLTASSTPTGTYRIKVRGTSGSLTKEADLTVTVSAPQKASLTLELEGNGAVVADSRACRSGTSCTWEFPKGTSLTLTALPDEGHYFAGWREACSGFGACALVLNEDARVKASFAPIVGDFQLGELPSPVVVPAGAKTELVVELVLMGGLSAPPGAYGVELSGRLVGTGVDQVQYRFLPERSQEGRLVLELQGPDPDEVWTYFSAPTELTVALGNLRRTALFHLAVAPCVAGCGR